MKPLKERLEFTRKMLSRLIWDEENRIKPSPENLQRLKELTEQLPTLNNFVENYENDRVVYEKNKFWGKNLLYIPDIVAVQEVFMAKDYEVPEHKHPEYEMGIVRKGSFILHYRNKDVKYVEGDVILLDGEEAHSGVMLEDTEMIFVTMPPSKGYPHA